MYRKSKNGWSVKRNMKLQTQGLIIKESNVGENDKLLVILTREHGIIRTFADGARRLKGKNVAATSLFCYGDFTLYKSKDTYKVTDVVSIELFFDLRYNLEALALAQYFCEIILKVTPEDFEPQDYLRLILNSLHLLIKEKKPLEQIKVVTELRIISLAGFMPNLVNCAVCKNIDKKKIWLSLSAGQLYCNDCVPKNEPTVVLNNTVLAAMRHIIYSDFGKIFSFQIPDRDLKYLSKISEQYISHQCDYHFKTLDFYKSVKV